MYGWIFLIKIRSKINRSLPERTIERSCHCILPNTSGICTRVYSLQQATTLREQGTDSESHDGGGDGCAGDEGDGDGDSDDGNDWKIFDGWNDRPST